MTVFFRYRQLRRPELGAEILDRLTEEIEGLGVVETRTGLESRRMTMVIAPVKIDTPKKTGPAKASKPPKPSKPKSDGAAAAEQATESQASA